MKCVECSKEIDNHGNSGTISNPLCHECFYRMSREYKATDEPMPTKTNSIVLTSQQKKAAISVLLFIVIFLICVNFLEPDRPEDYKIVLSKQDSIRIKEEEKQKACNDTSMAIVKAQRSIREQLKAPSTAKFPYGYERVRCGDSCTFVILGIVDAQNSFGAMLRSEYRVKIAYRPEQEVWEVISSSLLK